MEPASQTLVGEVERARTDFVERLLRSASGFFDIFSIYLGDQLGFYETLAADGPTTPQELARRTGTYPRYVREWLEQQAVAGILEVENPEDRPDARRFLLPESHRDVLADRESLDYLAPLSQILAGAVHPVRRVVEAYRRGEGVAFETYGPDLREGQARLNRAMLLYQLGQEWLPSIPGAHARLAADPPARVADIGCGAGWSSLGIARSYPKVSVDGYDLDAPSIELARAHAAEYGLADRVRFAVRDAGDPALAGRYDLVLAFESLHDMSRPVAALESMRRMAKEGATVLVVDERAGERFAPRGNDVDWFFYGWSVLHCLPVGLADKPSAGTGSVLRPATLRAYARDAGFRDVEVLPIGNFFFRFYRLIS